MTAAIVLAAGLGRRLAGATALPKWLVPVNDSCPAREQLSSFAGAGVERVYVVVGDVVAPVEEAVVRWAGDVPVELVANPRSADLNNWYSLLLGLRAWSPSGTDDVVVLNSDLFAAGAWFEALLGTIGGLDPTAVAALAVDPARGRTDEAMKVELDGEEIRAVGKRGVERPGGEYVGLSWWRRSAAASIEAELASFVDDPARADHWYEHAIQEDLQHGSRYLALPVPSSDWVEIDDESDLDAARALDV